MVNEQLIARYLKSLLTGDRNECRVVIEEVLRSGVPAHQYHLADHDRN
jgi:hypothetical protein